MNEDLEIKQLLKNAGNDLSDGDKFMADLCRNLDAVEDIKAYHEYRARKSRTIALAAFAIGGLLGAFFFAILILKPASSPQFALLLDSGAYVFLMSYKVYFLVAFGLIATVAGLLPLRKLEKDSM